jgi:predicted homoserine dehydrogenase-like protein
MNLFSMMNKRAEDGNPIRIGMIGAGKFGTMFLSQVRKLGGYPPDRHCGSVARNARSNMELLAGQPNSSGPLRWTRRCATGGTHVGDDWQALVAHPAIDIVIECTGAPVAAIDHILSAFGHGKHVINVTVEADAFCGYALAQEGRGSRRDLFDGLWRPAGADLRSGRLGAHLRLHRDCRWARAQMAARIPQIDAGNGVGPLGREPRGRRARTAQSEDVQFVSGRLQTGHRILGNRQCHRFLVPANGLQFPVGGAEDLANIMRPKSEGGALEQKGMVEVASALTLDGKPVPYDVRQGVWVVFEGETEYLRNCFQEYLVRTDDSGRYSSLYKRWHLIGLELPVSVASVGLRGEPTGVARCFNGDVAAIAKRDLAAGEILDGEGGYTVTGGLRPAQASLAAGYLPLGLAHDVKLKRAIADGEPVRFEDVEIDETTTAYKLRKWMETLS